MTCAIIQGSGWVAEEQRGEGIAGLEASEFIGIIRDLAIIVAAVVGLLVLTAVTLMAFLIYRKVAPLLDSTKATMKQTQEATSLLSEKLVKPMIGASAFAFTTGRVVGFILGVSKGRGGSKNGR